MMPIDHVNLARIDLNLLVAFDVLLAERSVTRAAARVGLGQSAMSHNLARLRALFGDELLTRGPQGMRPTPRALALAPDADPSIRGQAAYSLGICRAEQGLVEEAIEHCRTAYELLRDGPDQGWAARSLNSLASLSHDVGRSRGQGADRPGHQPDPDAQGVRAGGAVPGRSGR